MVILKYACKSKQNNVLEKGTLQKRNQVVPIQIELKYRPRLKSLNTKQKEKRISVKRFLTNYSPKGHAYREKRLKFSN